MRIYLIGYMASGKSNLGQVLAEKLGYSFTDTDYLFEKRFRISVLDFFEKYDEDGFRKIEQSLLIETTRRFDCKEEINLILNRLEILVFQLFLKTIRQKRS